MDGHGLQDMDYRTWIAGYRLQDTDMDMDRRTWIRTWIAGQGLQDMDTDMNCRTWTWTWVRNSKGMEFKSHQYIVYPV